MPTFAYCHSTRGQLSTSSFLGGTRLPFRMITEAYRRLVRDVSRWWAAHAPLWRILFVSIACLAALTAALTVFHSFELPAQIGYCRSVDYDFNSLSFGVGFRIGK